MQRRTWNPDSSPEPGIFQGAGLHLPRQRTPGGQGVKKIGLLVAHIGSLDQDYVKRILAAGNWRPLQAPLPIPKASRLCPSSHPHPLFFPLLLSLSNLSGCPSLTCGWFTLLYTCLSVHPSHICPAHQPPCIPGPPRRPAPAPHRCVGVGLAVRRGARLSAPTSPASPSQHDPGRAAAVAELRPGSRAAAKKDPRG